MYKLLEGIENPSDVKKLNTNELNELAQELRDFMLEHVSKTMCFQKIVC